MPSDYEAELAAAVTRFLADVEQLAQHHRDLVMSAIAPALTATAAPSPVRVRPVAAKEERQARSTAASAGASDTVRGQPTSSAQARAPRPKATSAKVTPTKATSNDTARPGRRTAPLTPPSAPTPSSKPLIRATPASSTPASSTPTSSTPTSSSPTSSSPTSSSPASSPPVVTTPVTENPVIEAPAIAAPTPAAPAPAPEPAPRAAPAPETAEGELCRGVVQWFDTFRGYGFIRGTDGRDAFVHQTALAGFGALAEGQLVEYLVQQTHKGLQAVSVARPTSSARGSR